MTGPLGEDERDIAPRRPSPTVRRRRLAIELRRLRESAGLTIERVAEELECSTSKISRIETGHVSATPRDVRDMLEMYGVPSKRRSELLQLARDARQKGWWQEYSDLPNVNVVGLESAAASIRMYSALMVPGLLQTEDYARAVLRAVCIKSHVDEIERRTELRMARQSLLRQDDAPTLSTVLDEGALRRMVGGHEIMRPQLDRLIRAAELPNVTLQLLPFESGAHAGMDGEFAIISFPEPSDPDVVYIDNSTSALYVENAETVRSYESLFNSLTATALDSDDSAKLLTKIASEV